MIIRKKSFSIILIFLVMGTTSLFSESLMTEDLIKVNKANCFVSMKLKGYIRNSVGNGLYKARVTVKIYGLGVATTFVRTLYTDINGYYSTTFLAESSVSFIVKVERYGYYTKVKTLEDVKPRVQSTVWISVNLPVITSYKEKIGVIFWSSSAAKDSLITKYVHILKREGYTAFFLFKNTDMLKNYKQRFFAVRSYEDINDIVFVYIIGHGEYSKTMKRSGVDLGSGDYALDPYWLKVELNQLESKNIGFLVEACQSGDFVINFLNTKYLAISSADKKKEAYHGCDGVCYFSRAFFDAVNDGKSAIGAYYTARNTQRWFKFPPFHMAISTAQNPLIWNGCSYNFFNPSSKPPQTPKNPIDPLDPDKPIPHYPG